MQRKCGQMYVLAGVAVVACLLGGAGSVEAAQQESAVKQTLPACREAGAGGPEDVVRALYRAYPPVDHPTKFLTLEPKEVLSKYFAGKPAELLAQIRQCSKRTGDDCGPGYDLMYDSNAVEISDLRICAMAGGKKTVTVQFRDAGRPKFVTYELTHTSSGWRIADILYAKKPGDSYSDSLIKLLTDLLSSESSK